MLGGVPVEIVFEAAKRKNALPNGVSTLEEFRPFATTPAKCTDLSGFLDVFYSNLNYLSNDKQAIKDIVNNFCQSQASQGIYYTEVRFTPHKLAGDKINIDQIVEQVINGLEKGCQRHNIKVTLILSLLSRWNGDNDQRSKDILRLMKKYKYNAETNPCGIVGIDIAGNEPERHAPIRPQISFINSFKQAKDMGFGVTVHAGEGLNCGWDKVKHAINNEFAMRIGHGYHLVMDAMNGNKDAQDFLFKLGNNDNDINDDINVHFECCPTSSVLTNSVDYYEIKDLKNKNIKWDKHPINMLLKYNIPFSLNTDDPAVFQCDINQEMMIAHDKIGLTWKQIGDCFINGAKASFLHAKEKEKLVKTIEIRVNQWLKTKYSGNDHTSQIQSKL